MTSMRLGVCLAVALGFAAGGARAAVSHWSETDQGAVRLISATDAVGERDHLSLGLEFRMKPGWKIYWRSPGDAGFPPQPDWAGSDNLASADIQWPAPTRFSVLGLETLGYHDAVVLPVDAALKTPGEPLTVRAKLRYLTCNDICIPYDTELSLALPAGAATPSEEAGEIARYAALVPRESGTGLAITDAQLGADHVLHVDARADRPFEKPDLYVEGPPRVSFSAPSISLSADRTRAAVRVAVSGSIDAAPLTFTLVDGARAVEARRTPSREAAAPTRGETGSLAAFMLLALVGGLILNLMPCVLPVISLKLLAVVRHGGGHAREVRTGFVASAAGIVASFLLLGSAAVVLKEAGLAAGWGIQFQQPIFLGVMIAVLLAFAANLWGIFEFRLPGRVSDTAAGATGNFATGALAALLATPCSAPFVGTAVGFALARGPFDIYAIFLALGVGLAAPYLAVAAWPRVATALPRPGRWMIHLRRLLGVALVGTAVWLGFVLTSVTMQGQGTAETASTGPWRPFEPAAIADEVRLGRVVVVEVTADWCITCKVNKQTVLDRGPVSDRLAGRDVTAMLADWTRPDPAIARYLARYGRYGIPFTAVYGPATPQGQVLPELLTDSTVLDAIRKASGGA
jgi:suppressor for copper-sensitivity B